MDKNKLIEVLQNPSTKSNKDLNESSEHLYSEFEKTKQTIIELTHYLDRIELAYNTVNEELNNRVIKV